ncbi:MAG TPA: serine/threonine-protein kinase [Cyanophyceae cyanobacterium]
MDRNNSNFDNSLTPLPTSNLPAFSQRGYQIERELGHNKGGGRVTYLATQTISPFSEENQVGVPVVIKQFQFAKTGANWSDYDAHEQEIALLQQLNSPSIPQYLDAFETSNGFCLVQEYKNAPSLAQQQQFNPDEIKAIAVEVLKVLVYLQQQIPPVIHRDIKPENILVDRQAQPLKVYLVDFGLARQGSGDVAASSAVKGTLGFMPPEQLFNRQLTEASDLYSLGITLICLLTKTSSTAIGNLIDDNYRINVKSLLPHLNSQFLDWLSKMVEPNLKNRFPNAATALEALLPINIVGESTNSGYLAKAINYRLTASKILIFSLSVVALSIATLSLSHKRNNLDVPLSQLQETRQCQRCNLSGADLRGMNLKGVDLTGADLKNADLRGTDLRSATLKDVNLTNADLRAADLRGTYLENADLTEADLRGTNLNSTDLRGVNFNKADTRGAIMPDGFRERVDGY